ncbi:MAG: DUF2142 domain-containing protein [Lachnospiraceae bacterium]|nr:DUF2142 domain-containing protein [Lachnospiraceae bacterium]
MDEKKVLNTLLILLFICGTMIIFLTPPLSAPDEDRHFLNAYACSKGDFYIEKNPETGEWGKYYPAYILYFHKTFKGKFQGKLDEKISFSEVYPLSWQRVGEPARESEFLVGELWGVNNPWSFFFPAIGMKLWRLMGNLIDQNLDTAYNLLLAGRFLNFLAFFCISTLAIKITPFLKKTMIFLVSMPMTLFLSASLSYDAIVISVTFLLLAEVLSLIFVEEKKVKKIDMVIIGFCALFLTAIKPVYAPFFLLCFFIPQCKFGAKRNYIISIVIVMLAGILGFGIPSLINSLLSSASQGGESIFDAQKIYFLNHIFEFPQYIINSFKEFHSFYITSFFGNLGALDTNYPVPFIVLCLLCLFIISFTEISEIEGATWKLKAANIIILIFVLLATYGYIYLTWTPIVLGVGTDVISGVQGRYFIPLYCFAILLFAFNGQKKLPQVVNEQIKKYTCVFNYTICFFMIISVPIILLIRYWI